MTELSQQCRILLYWMMWQTPDGIVDAFALSLWAATPIRGPMSSKHADP